MMYEREIEGTPFRYCSDTGRLWRWVEKRGKYFLKNPHWRETGLCKDPCGYFQVQITTLGAKRVHRVVWLIVNEEWPDKGFEVSHLNGNSMDNRLDNLKLMTHVENMRAQHIKSSNTSGVRGVSWHAKCKKWQVEIGTRGTYKYLGLFNTLEEAAAARKEAEIKYGYGYGNGAHAVGEKL